MTALALTLLVGSIATALLIGRGIRLADLIEAEATLLRQRNPTLLPPCQHSGGENASGGVDHLFHNAGITQ